MAGPLANAKHELFCQGLLEGLSQEAAFTKAGYRHAPGNANKAFNRPDVQARMTELLSAAAEKAVITAHDIALQLDEDRAFARSLDAPGPAITATMGKAKVLGLLADRVEHTGKDGGPIQTEDISDQDAVARMLFVIARARKEKAATLN